MTALNNSQFPHTNGVDMAGITNCALALVGIGVWVLVAEFLTVALLTHSAARQTRVMREAVLEALVYQDMAYFDTSNPFSLSADIGGNMVVVQDGLGRKLGQFAKHTTQVVLAVAVGIQRGWNVGLGIAATFPLFLLAIYVFVTHISKSTNLEADEYARAGAVAEEALSAPSTVLAFNAQPSMTARFTAYLHAGDAPYRKLSKVIATAVACIQFVSFVLFGYGLWLGAQLVARQDSVVPTMKRALPAIMVEIAGLLAIGSAAPALEALASARAAAAAVVQLERQRAQIDCRATGGRELDIVHGCITFKDVVFAYPTRARELVLKSCSFTIAAGQRVALVGPSGSGKSTIIRLMERLYDPAFGHITLDNVDVRDLSVRWLRKQFGVVRQEPVLFATTVMENIRYGYAAATDAQVIDAAQRAHAHDFILALPDGYNTQIGANGSLLARGQRQRLAIARALVKNPAMLLLDEATVALDAESDDAVQRAFDDLVLSARITTIVIAHRLVTLAAADVVFIVEDGKVAEQGTYATLSQDPRSRYCALFGGSDGDKEREQTRLTEMHRQSTARFRAKQRTRGHEQHELPGAPSILMRPSHIDDEGVRPTVHRHGECRDASAFVDTRVALDARRVDAESTSFFFVKDSIASTRASDMAWLEAGRSTVGMLAEPSSGAPPSPFMKPAAKSLASEASTATTSSSAAASARDARSVVAKIFALMAVDRRYVVIAMSASVVNGVVNPLAAILRANIVSDMYAVEAARDYVGMRALANTYVLLFIGAGAVLGASYFLQSLNFRLLGRNLTNRMRSLTFASMLAQDMAWFDAPEHAAGALSAMLASDTAAVKIIAGEIQGRKVQNIVVIIVATVLAFVVGSWQATLVFLGVVPLLIATIVLDQRTAWYANEAGDRSLATAGRIANEIVHNVETIAEHDLQETVLRAYREALELPTRVAIATGYSTGLALGVGQFVKWLGYAALHYASAHLIRRGATTFALFYRTMNLMNVAALCVDETATFIGDEKVARAAAERVFALMAPAANDAASGETLHDRFTGGIDVASADFAYPLQRHAPVLRAMTLSAHGGKTTVLVGGSASGKSTLLQLLLRLYDATGGSILVSGVPIERLDVRWLRSRVALVAQDPALFRLSVLENVRLGCPRATLADVTRVCRAVNAHDFIAALPDAYDTVVDTDKLARGQTQRLALARALLLDPRVLLLDNATSALDAESRAVVLETLRQYEAERRCTIVSVTTQRDELERAESIAVVAHGRVVERGSHDELVRVPGGAYAAMTARTSSPKTEL